MSWNFFLILIPIYSYSLFLPSIIEGLGYSNVTAQLFTVPPNFLAFLVVIVTSFISDKIKMRGPLILAGFTIAAVGYIMQLASSLPGVRYGGTFLIAAGAFPCSPLILAWLSNNLAPHYTKATGLGFQVAIGNCGAFVATFTYLSSKQTDRYEGGMNHLLLPVSDTTLAFALLCSFAYSCRQTTKSRQGNRSEYHTIFCSSRPHANDTVY